MRTVDGINARATAAAGSVVCRDGVGEGVGAGSGARTASRATNPTPKAATTSTPAAMGRHEDRLEGPGGSCSMVGGSAMAIGR
jgi:hypothetical protein